MLERVGHSVIRLKRTKIGALTLGDVPIGSYSHLTPGEVKGLRDMAEGKKTRDGGQRTRDAENHKEWGGRREETNACRGPQETGNRRKEKGSQKPLRHSRPRR